MKFDREIRLLYGAHQIFIRLGFDPAALYTGINWGRVILVAAPGYPGLADQSELAKVKPRFVFTVCQTEMYEACFNTKWLQAIEQIQSLRNVTVAERDAMVAEFERDLDRVGLVIALYAKGMLPGQSTTTPPSSEAS
ncbi:MAG TPA: hypothetical protein VGM94_00835 [Galbitalea sp.]